MKEIKMRSFNIYYKEGEDNKNLKVVAKDFVTALVAKFGNDVTKWPDISSLYSDEVIAYI